MARKADDFRDVSNVGYILGGIAAVVIAKAVVNAVEPVVYRVLAYVNNQENELQIDDAPDLAELGLALSNIQPG